MIRDIYRQIYINKKIRLGFTYINILFIQGTIFSTENSLQGKNCLEYIDTKKRRYFSNDQRYIQTAIYKQKDKVRIYLYQYSFRELNSVQGIHYRKRVV